MEIDAWQVVERMERKQLLETFRAPDYHGYVMVKRSDLPAIRAYYVGEEQERRAQRRASVPPGRRSQGSGYERTECRTRGGDCRTTRAYRERAAAMGSGTASCARGPAGPIPAAPGAGHRLVKVKEAVQILGVSTSTIHKLMNEGALRKHAVTGHIARSELDRFIREQPKAR